MVVPPACCKRLLRKAPRDTAPPQLHPVWLSFQDVGKEEGFVRHCTKRLQRNMFRGTCAFVLFLVWGMAVHDDLEPNSVEELRVHALLLGISVVVLVLLCIPTTRKVISPRGFELLGISCALLALGVALSWLTYWKVLLRQNRIPDAYLKIAFGSTNVLPAQARTDSALIQYICVFIAAVHWAVPIRFRILLWVDLAGFCLYPACVTASETWQGKIHWRDTVTLFLLISLAVFGKHHTEHTERELFAKYLSEKTLRVTTEFKLLDEQTKRQSDACSNAAFQCIGATEDVQQDLKGVLELGRREHWLIESESLRLEPQHVLGRGGFGRVCAARLHGTPVAVKMHYAPMGSTECSALSRFTALGSELRVLRRLRHPNIIAFHGWALLTDLDAAGSSNTQFGIVLERVFGQELSRFMHTALPAERFVPIVVDISRALQYMHSQTPQVLHTDLKPSNVLVESMSWQGSVWPRAKLIDFGLARVLDPAGTWGRHGGTREWMAPEQLADSKSTTTASDVFALGSVMCYMETGQPPANPASWNAITRPFLSESSRGVALQCLSVSCRDRPESVNLVRAQLEADIPADMSNSDEFSVLRSNLSNSSMVPDIASKQSWTTAGTPGQSQLQAVLNIHMQDNATGTASL